MGISGHKHHYNDTHIEKEMKGIDDTMTMNAVRGLIRNTIASRNPVFRLISSRTQATSTAPTPVSGTAADMVFTFASPSEDFYNQAKNIRQIDIPTMSGNMGILAHHVPILGVLKPGVVSVFELDGNTKRFFVSSGSIAVHPDSSVQLLAEEATLVENLDTKACQDVLSDAQRRLGSAKDEKQKAEVQIEIDCAEASIKASSGAFQ